MRTDRTVQEEIESLSVIMFIVPVVTQDGAKCHLAHELAEEANFLDGLKADKLASPSGPNS
jgi:hypothetical protein